jgi:hypothetical protein
VPNPIPVALSWRKSSASGSGDCVEAAAENGYILLRDSKRKHSQILRFTIPKWESFLSDVRSGRLNTARNTRIQL